MPDPTVPWMVSHTGAAFAVQVRETSEFDIYLTGRDTANRSLIGRVRLDIRDLSAGCEISPEPVFKFGELGAFDEAGVSYPFLINRGDQVFMYYTAGCQRY